MKKIIHILIVFCLFALTANSQITPFQIGTTGVVPSNQGGTGVNNSNRTITVAGTSSITFTTTGTTNVTLPTSGTLATSANIDSATAVKNAMTTIVIGNSIAAQSQWQSSVGGFWNTKSDVHYANAFAGNPMLFKRVTATTRMDGYGVYGYSGQTSGTILSDLQGQVFTALQTSNIVPTCVWGHSLIENDISTGVATATIQANIIQFIRDIQGRFPGVIIILSTPRPSFAYDTPTEVTTYQTMVSYIQGLDNSKNIFVTTLNAYEDPGSPAQPLSGYTDATVHPNAKGAVLLARTEAATFQRIAKVWRQPYYAVSANMALSGTGAASGTNVSGTVPTNVTITGNANATWVGTAEQPGFKEQITIPAGTTVGAFLALASSNFSALSITTTNNFQFSSFIKMEIVNGAQNLNNINLWARITDGSGSPFVEYISAQTGDAQPTWQNGDVLTFIMPPQIAVTAPITAINNYIVPTANLVQDGSGFAIRIIEQGIFVVQDGIPVTTSTTSGLTSTRVPFVTTNGKLTDDASLTYSTSTGLSSTKDIITTGSLGSTGTRVLKGWFTDLQVTNAISGSITGNAATVTTNANLTGAVTSSGNATSLGSFSSSDLSTALTNETGSGSAVFSDSPILTTQATIPIVIGSSSSSGNLTLESTSNATKGKIIYGTSAYDEAKNFQGFGTQSPLALVHLKGNITASAWTTLGIGLRSDSATYTNSTSSGTVANNYGIHSLLQPTLAASSSTTFSGRQATLYIESITNGTNATLNNPRSIYATGISEFVGTVYSPNVGSTTGLNILSGTSTRITVNTNGLQTHTHSAVSSGSTPFLTYNQNSNTGGSTGGFTWNAGSHTGQTASTQIRDFKFSIGRTVTWLAGNITTQNFFDIADGNAPTMAFASGSNTVTDAVLTRIGKSPIAGANCAGITRSWSLRVVGNTAIGTKLFVGDTITAPSAFVHIQGTTEQLRSAYDGSNYMSTTVGSTGSTTFSLTGTSPTFTFSQGILRRVTTATDATSITPTGDASDVTKQINTQATGTLTINAPTGTPTDGQRLEFVIKSTNVQTFAWNAIFTGCTTTALPTTTTGASKTDKFYFEYNSTSSKWEINNAQYGY